MSKWIRTKKQRPADRQKVICYTVGNFFSMLRWNEYESAWEENGQFYFPDYVTHWMELPQPPKAVRNG